MAARALRRSRTVRSKRCATPTVYVGGKKHNMLTEVDYISAISGGAVLSLPTMASYRDRIFDDFGKEIPLSRRPG